MPCVCAVAIPYTAMTIIFIVLAAAVGGFARRRSRDRCLKDFAQNMVTLEETSGKTIWGRLRVENTGIELVYLATHKDEDGHNEASYILYKYEYPKMTALARFHDDLSVQNKRKRDKELRKTYHPGLLRRLRRKIRNVFKTLRDSAMEVVNLLMSQAGKAAPAGGMLASQDKYVSQMKRELTASMGTAYEPLLERYIGHKVVVELIKGDKLLEYCGVLKDYTAEFIEIMDVDYKVRQTETPRKADMVVPRNYGVVRHLGE